MISKVPALPQDFAFQTAAGDVLLLEELVREVLVALEMRGVEADALPVEWVLRAMRQLTEQVAAEGREIPPREQLCRELSQVLRSHQLLLTPAFIERVLEAYLEQLRRLDISRVCYL
jgi:hypothetical protein